jgi:hypothetical protein
MRFATVSLALTILTCGAAYAQDCGPLKQLTSLEATPLNGSSVMTVQASFNGTPKPMIVQTGAMISSVREGALADLGLHAIANSIVITVKDRKQSSEAFTQVENFSLGAIRVPRMQFQVPPDTTGEQPWVGILGSDLFQVYDMEIDPAGHKINFFAKDHCPGHVLYWNPTAVAVLPFQSQLNTASQTRTGFNLYFTRGASIYVPVKLDGQDITASISTGSQYSYMGANMAKSMFGVTATSPGSKPAPDEIDDPTHASFIHTFPTLTFDTVTVTNARVLVYPDPDDIANADIFKRTDTRLRQGGDYFVRHMSIGMDILRRLRLFIAFGEKKLYITPATAPVAALPAGTTAPPVDQGANHRQ